METLRIKNALNRPRVFSVVDPEGEIDAIRMLSGATVNIDVRLLTPEIVANIEKGGHLLLLEGKLPMKLNPYPEKKREEPTPEISDAAVTYEVDNSPIEDEGDVGKRVFKKGVKN